MQTILVAGGAGFIGSHLCDFLLGKGDHVICVDNLLTGSRGNIEHLLINPAFTFLNHNVNEEFPEIEKVDAIFHLASPASPNHHSKLSYHALPLETMLVNTQGTLNLLKLAEKNQAKFLFASTSEAYGDPLQHPQREDYRGNVSTIGPRSVYDEAKRFGETITSYFWRERHVDARIVRIFNTYGPRLAKADMRMISVFIQQALTDKPLTVFGDGQQTRSLCYVSDLIEGLNRLMFYPETKGQVVNLGSQEEHTVLEYATMIKELTNSRSEIVFSEKLPEDDPIKRQPDITKAQQLLQWEPKVSLHDGLMKMIEAYRVTE
ncbi:MAG TPA: NAD-dependent epimerase/dehydratase family protein [Patescibacteria group bacterium]|nr:NAD-dependent epimerase/dehydratase family protein [Patescibacteria group bacterium]